MPTVTLALRSQRKKPIPDEIKSISIRGLVSGPVQSGDIEFRPGGEIVLDLVPDHYTIDIEPAGFVPSRGKVKVGFDPVVSILEIENLITRLPTVGELSKEQKRLLTTLDASKTEAEIWDALSDNKAATFFQVTHALTEVMLADGTALSTVVDRVVRVGGSQLTAPDPTGTPRTVIGWRMHVVFVGGTPIADLLLGAKFKRDPGEAHPTHKRFGFVKSFREKGTNPRLQVVTNHEGVSADVDLDNGVFHKSSPHDVFKNFAKRFPAGAKVYKVK
jgi:hypothetical protein